MKRGLVIGKFYPPHAGHSYLIDTALAGCGELDVLVCDSPAYKIPARQRAKWLKQIHPKAHVKIIADIGKDDDSAAWAEHTMKFLGYAPDIVFSSEDYGKTYAGLMGARHKLVDKKRLRHPVSGTLVRKNVLKQWRHIKEPVRRKYARRICVLGAESTGTTTLAKALAKHYKTFWVPEYGRLYSEAKVTAGFPVDWNSSEFEHIAKVQTQMEDKLASVSDGLIICDTNAFATRLWHRRYMGDFLKSLDKYIRARYDLYIVTAPDIPFEQDGTRDGEFIRQDMHRWFVEELKKHDLPYVIVRGTRRKRLMAATKKIDKILERKITI